MAEARLYKLRMFGAPVEGATNFFGDNKAVYKNTSLPESTLKKKHHSMAYHRCREAVAAGTIRVAKEGTKTNLTDLIHLLYLYISYTKITQILLYCIFQSNRILLFSYLRTDEPRAVEKYTVQILQ
jgi:hypothetical protein